MPNPAEELINIKKKKKKTSLLWYNFRFTKKLQREYREFPHTLDPASPDVNILHNH